MRGLSLALCMILCPLGQAFAPKPMMGARRSTDLAMLPMESVVPLISTLETSPEPIHTAFSVATFLPQPFWLLMILFPKAEITKKIMGGLGA